MSERSLAFHMKQHGWTVYHIGDLRGVGKTEALCKLAKEEGGVVVSSHEGSAKYARDTFGLTDQQAVSYGRLSTLRGTKYPLFTDEFVVSNLVKRESKDFAKAANDLIDLINLSDKILVNKFDVKAVYILIKDLKDEIRDLFFSSETSLLDQEVITKIQHRQTLVKNIQHAFLGA